MQFLTIALANNKVSIMRTDYDDIETSHPVIPSHDFEKSTLWRDIDKSLLKGGFENGNLFYTHHCGFDPEALQKDDNFRKSAIVTSTSVSKKGVTFVASIEHRDYPFYGYQYHPEKTQYERIGPVFLERDETTMKFCSSLIATIIGRVKKYARPLNQIDPFVRGFFEVYYIPVRPKNNSFEQVYLFHSIQHPPLMIEKL